ncbi:UDP-N-acetylglucosamine transporter isoform X1 [Trichoplusia ni]|uniref:UDP-N-acetylglucosamine transporter isoform X1 n=2 Tax=Trichoplusia ni TaxID=7111 RepID=A0A7E5X3V8_TRINI|nr:UDP-N-acetylglucosamine transporter isoform X1 [Trichoplusia ni]XP_026747076.1 UDP-N-acetylglucosamine transporter isoform X1 [Trichoplusia ni]XP_026747077.1 UDP-N-acetylglucosamine transporter isoform X1 [Trichoplusia ni]XP_026747078.1 UDP-N-acetylglucosamine transporter isoform X1 [Trichoplusia ni]
MKSTDTTDELAVNTEHVASEGVELDDLQDHTPVTTQLNKNEDNMDGDSKKAQYMHNRRVNFGYIKYVSLLILTIQNAALGLSMRYARTRDVEMFSSAAAVLMAEVFKLIICVCLVMQESGGVHKGAQSIYNIVILNVRDTLRVCVPSVLYIVQNNLLYLSASNLDAATYQVTYQLKILTTAFFAVLVLKRSLKKWQWLALAILAGGVALVQLSSSEKAHSTKPSHLPEQSKLLGFGAALAACFISGFAGIYFEKVLKESDISVWMRNVQLSLLSLPFGTITYLINEGTKNNLLKGFDGFVWYLVILQAAGGLIVAVVVKYADNILKGFATSVAIIISCIASIYLFDFNLTVQFALGTMFVIFSIFLYGYVPKKPEPRTSLNEQEKCSEEKSLKK